MAQYMMKIEYDGGNYAGWQVQPKQPTVQGELERALFSLYQREVKIVAASRTDAGVHARGQVASFQAPLKRKIGSIKQALNALTPPDINVWQVKSCATDFHPQRDNKGKIYSYNFSWGPSKPALMRAYSWHIGKRLDLALMRQAGASVIGRHDFSAFRDQDCQNPNPVKTIVKLEISQKLVTGVHLAQIRLVGDGFLKHMARIIVGTLVDIGRLRLGSDCILQGLRLKKRSLLGQTAPARGLCLEEVLL